MDTTGNQDDFANNPTFKASVQRTVDALLPNISVRIREEVRQEMANATDGSGGSGGANPPDTILTWLGRFNKQKPRSFSTVTSPDDAEHWIAHMEKIFEVLGCGDVYKARLATYKFEGDALNWWKAYKYAKGGNGGNDYVATLSWASFREIFLSQYFPLSEKEKTATSGHLVMFILALSMRGVCVMPKQDFSERRWVLEFPIVQRPLFFSYKMGVRKAIVKAVRLSSAGYLVSLALPIFIKEHKEQRTVGAFFAEQIVFYFASFVVFLCWELNCHLLQVFLTERYLFAPTKGSAAAETNPSDHLLAALEESTSRSLIRYLAYLDLCMVSESNVDTWRRAAFFEETGETYKKVIGVCLKPLEQLTLELSEGLGSSPENSFQLSNQLRSSNEPPRLYEPFYDHQGILEREYMGLDFY
ncbi:Nucleoporin protein Ndc1-Nup [Artemisia annua]|uniref:Nucleoporin protein Ndc1-Nup n=1 Tax=Artemisia annua TaxID=35608 RepID=A0A2U1N0S3_ARTAN|nr:Nucleoporin protein Ndc1-Nup [Artemisia annua]